MTFQSQSLVFAILALSGCAHSYSFLPEVAGDGARAGKGGTVYAIPPTHPQIQMKLTSLGIHKSGDVPEAWRKDPMLELRMYIQRADGPCAPAYLVPGELLVKFTDGPGIHPVLIHAGAKRAKTLELTCTKREAVELYFPVPPAFHGPKDIEQFTFQWKLHLGTTAAEERVARFEREDKAPQQSAELFPDDPFYPYDISPILTPGWFRDDPFWWEPFPMW